MLQLPAGCVHVPKCVDSDLQNSLSATVLEHASSFDRPRMVDSATGANFHRIAVISFGIAWDPHEHRYVPPIRPVPSSILAVADRLRERYWPHDAVVFDSVVVNHYQCGESLRMHQDDLEDPELLRAGSPVLSISLGCPCEYLLGGLSIDDQPLPIRLLTGDLLLLGGPSRLRFHGVSSVEQCAHDLGFTGRMSLTCRQVHVGNRHDTPLA